MGKQVRIKKVLTRSGSGGPLDKLDLEEEVNKACQQLFESGHQVVDVKYHHYLLPEGSAGGEIAIIVYHCGVK